MSIHSSLCYLEVISYLLLDLFLELYELHEGVGLVQFLLYHQALLDQDIPDHKHIRKNERVEEDGEEEQDEDDEELALVDRTEFVLEQCEERVVVKEDVAVYLRFEPRKQLLIYKVDPASSRPPLTGLAVPVQVEFESTLLIDILAREVIISEKFLFVKNHLGFDVDFPMVIKVCHVFFSNG